MWHRNTSRDMCHMTTEQGFFLTYKSIITEYMVNYICAKTVPDSTKLRKISQGNMPPDPPSLPHALHTNTYLPPKILPPCWAKADRNPCCLHLNCSYWKYSLQSDYYCPPTWHVVALYYRPSRHTQTINNTYMKIHRLTWAHSGSPQILP